MNKNQNRKLLLFILLSISITACASKSVHQQNEAEPLFFEIKRASGQKVTVPKKVTKIVSLAPSVTQLLDLLGKKEQLVAVDTQSFETGQINMHLPQFDMMAVDLERLLALQPDIIYVTDLNQQADHSRWATIRKAGITVLEIPTSRNVVEIQQEIQLVADSLALSEQGREIVQQMQHDIDAVRTIGQSITTKKKVLFEISQLPTIFSFGQEVYIHDMLSILGATNVFSDQVGWFSVTEEAAIASNPDVIITSVNYLSDPVTEIMSRKNWRNVSAIKNMQVFQVDQAITLPNHQVSDILIQLANLIYPEEYKDVSQ